MQLARMAIPCTVHRLGLVEYEEAWAEQRRLAAACREDGRGRLLLLEHPPTYTFGARGRQEHLLLAEEALAELGIAVHRVDRGGDVTFHGPGQLVGYPILDLRRWRQGPLWYVRSLETMLIDALSAFDIEAVRVPGRTGVWVGEAKIAAIGVRVARGVTSHGFALNVDPDLNYFSNIIPCGLPDAAVTSIAEVLRDASRGDHPVALGLSMRRDGLTGRTPEMDAVMDAVVAAFARTFPIDILAAQRRDDRLVALARGTR